MGAAVNAVLAGRGRCIGLIDRAATVAFSPAACSRPQMILLVMAHNLPVCYSDMKDCSHVCANEPATVCSCNSIQNSSDELEFVVILYV